MFVLYVLFVLLYLLRLFAKARSNLTTSPNVCTLFPSALDQFMRI